MPDLKQFRLPDVGEGLTEADILSWSVQPGDTVVVNQTIVEVETAKAAVELPSPFAGVVTNLHAVEGETVEVGRPIITIDTDPNGEAPADRIGAPGSPNGEQPPTGSSAAGDSPSAGSPSAGSPSTGSAAADSGREAVLVGYGPRSGPVTRRVRRSPGPREQVPTPTAQAAFAVDPSPSSRPAAPDGDSPTTEPVPAPAAVDGTDHGPRALAKPPVRKLAKTLGVDLDGIAPTGPNGSVSREDVQRAVAGVPTPRRDGGAREERIAIKGVRKHTAAAMVASAFTAPHVTEFVTADVTAMMDLRSRLGARREFAQQKVSPLLLVARAALWAIARTPIVNSTWDEAAGEIVVKHYVNLGIAAATGRGLVVPNVKGADAMSLVELGTALKHLTDTARAGRTTPGDMAGGTFTITNVGVFGVDTGTPILNPGESAILAVGAVRRMPWVVQHGDTEVIEPRWVTQLALSFDHRVVDGEQGSVFLADVAGVLTDPGLALL